MEFRNFFIISVLLATQCFAALQKAKKPELNPRLGHNQEKIRTIFSSILPIDFRYSYSTSGNDYNAQFRPRGENETSEDDTQLNPTITRINLKFLKLTALNDTNLRCGSLKVTGKIGVEFLDSRLAYDAPDGIKFVEFSEASDQLWFPRLNIGGKYLRLNNRDRYNGYNSQNDQFETHARAWISPEGLVYHDVAFERELTSCKVGAENSNGMEFEMQILSDKDLVDDVQLEWAPKNAVNAKEESIKSINGMDYKVSVTHDKCKLVENFGSFGEQEFGCLTSYIVLGKI
ncbi:hypothetical protein Fcan01_17597 [Folsomia candida]|uniref:Uncharacterized protein n=1 Tax=Folsomia candida TaxID=158441 RepID=A0A226DRQ8_FOLCA|nr:hypothetical protein Fcan01_17597 [Folsomia candida]